MKFNKTIFFSLALLLSLYNLSYSQNLNFMTYNIRYSIENDPKDNWDSRKEGMARLLNYYHAHVLGIQEGMQHQLQYIKSKLKQYDYIGVAREDGNNEGEFCAIFYDTSQLKILQQNTFWLSENNTIKKGWDAGYIRICTYALFETIDSKTKFWIFNTHFDHIGSKARENSANLILDKINELNTENFPLLLMGDLNDIPTSKPLSILNSKLQDAYKISQTTPYGPKGTFNGFNANKIIDRRIDYILVSKFKVLNHRHIDDRLDNNQFISDHLPVFIQAKVNR